MTQTITPTVSLNILAEIPRFFTSPQSALREIIQNSIRAGATHLEISHTQTTTRFKDNGRGLDNPQLLLTVAQSGWDSQVIDPAGMGVLSVLDKCSQVIFKSHNWAVSLNLKEFAQAMPIVIRPNEWTEGFEIVLEHPTFTTDTEKLLYARAIANITLAIDGEEIPPITVKGTPFTIPEGTVYLRQENPYISHVREIDEQETYWEGFPVYSGLEDYIIRHLKPSQFAKHALQATEFSFIPDKNSGILPKLPDRNAFIENEAWKSAAQHILDLITAQATQPFEHLTLGKIVDIKETLKQVKPQPLINQENLEYLFKLLLTEKGYDIYWTFDEDTELTIEQYSQTVSNEVHLAFHQSITVPAGDHEITALWLLGKHVQGLPFHEDWQGEKAKLELVPCHQALGITLCSTLKYGDVSIPWFIQENNLLILGDPATAEQTVAEWKLQMAATRMHHDWDHGEVRSKFEVENGEIVTPYDYLDAINLQLQKFFPERLKTEQEIIKKDLLQRNIEAITKGISKLPEDLQIFSDSQLQQLTAASQKLEAEIQSLKQTLP